MIAWKIVLIAHAGDYLRVIILHLPLVIHLIQPSFTPFPLKSSSIFPQSNSSCVCIVCAFFFDGNRLLTALFLSSLFPSLPTEAHKYIIAGKQNIKCLNVVRFVVQLNWDVGLFLTLNPWSYCSVATGWLIISQQPLTHCLLEAAWFRLHFRLRVLCVRHRTRHGRVRMAPPVFHLQR